MNETSRLLALKKYEILDSEPEKDFDDIVDLVGEICEAPISLISFIDQDRQWFKAINGIDVKETERKIAFCNYAIKNPSEVLVVPDSTLDERFSANPLVIRDPNVRFYAGAPLVDKEGYALGTLCVLDNKPREFTEKDKKILITLANRVVQLIELRKENLLQKLQLVQKQDELNLMLNRFVKAQQAAKIGSWDWDVIEDELYWSPEMYRIYEEVESENNALQTWQSKVHKEDIERLKSKLVGGLKEGKSCKIEYRIIDSKNEILWLEGICSSDVDESGRTVRMHGTVQDITAHKKAEEDKLSYSKMLETLLFDFSHKVRQPLANCMGITQVIDYDTISLQEARKLASYIGMSAAKFDSLIREMSDLVHQNKSEITRN
ncbi:MAG: GAF domain-containing protein [Ekhidna sp.]